jgi:hypothetical protein
MATHGRTNVKLVTLVLSKTLLDKMAVTRQNGCHSARVL